MNSGVGSFNTDPVEVIKRYYEPVEMSDDFRRDLLVRTSGIVSARRRVRFFSWAAGLGGAVAAVALLLLAWGPNVGLIENIPALRIVGRPSGQMLVTDSHSLKVESGKSLKVGDVVKVGTAVETDETGEAKLITRGGSQIYLDSDTKIEFSSRRVAKITKGRMLCKNSDKEIEKIDTPAGQIRLLGTIVDTNVTGGDRVEVTVVEGKVELSNGLGKTVVEAGRKSVLVASAAPGPGVSVKASRVTDWYQGKGYTESDFGDVVYTVKRNDYISEVWVANKDGSGKRRVKSFFGMLNVGPWLHGEKLINVEVHGIIKPSELLLNAVSGETMPLGIPYYYSPDYISYSADPDVIAFTGLYRPNPNKLYPREGGLWVYNRASGDIKRVYDDFVQTRPVWSPDGRFLAISPYVGRTGILKMMIYDLQTGEIEDLGIDGFPGSFSPDGRRLVYTSKESDKNRSRGSGITGDGEIYVINLYDDWKPIRITEDKKMGVGPQWSPDGKWILYRSNRQCISIAAADGSGVKKSFTLNGENKMTTFSWGPSGDVIYMNVYGGGGAYMIPVAADGPETIDIDRDFTRGGVISAEAEKQAVLASVEIEKAVYLYNAGHDAELKANYRKMRTCYRQSADIFAKLAWDYPLVDFDVNHIKQYTDIMRGNANRTDEEILEQYFY